MDSINPKIRNVICKWYWGPTRLGKTWKAINDMDFNISSDSDCDLKGLYFKNPNNKWWDGYYD